MNKEKNNTKKHLLFSALVLGIASFCFSNSPVSWALFSLSVLVLGGALIYYD